VNTNITISAITALPQIRMTIWDFCKLDYSLASRANERSWKVDAADVS
jgi:hypothetical protein